MGSWESKVVIITGGLGGIGRAAVAALAGRGARLVVTDLVDRAADEVLAAARTAGAEATFVPADLAVESEARRVVDHALATFGRLDGAFNNAGISQVGTPLTELSSEEFERVLRVNVLGVFHCLKHQMRAMEEGGAIVNTSSAQGVIGLLNQGAYAASKHAVCGLTRAAAVEGAERGIRVNAVLPGAIRTPMQEDAHGAAVSPASSERIRQLHLLGRVGEPTEVADAVAWLLSDESSFVTGSLIPVEGGLTAGRRL